MRSHWYQDLPFSARDVPSMIGQPFFWAVGLTYDRSYFMSMRNSVRTIAILGILLVGSVLAQTSTSDCDGAIQLCGGVFTEISAPPGTGNVYEFTGVCNANVETMSLWYTFTVQEAGDLNFVLDPANDLDDYDWGLFNVTNGGCAGINAQDGTSPEVNCNSYGSLANANGATGISSANGGTGTSNGPGDTNGPAFNADLAVQAGQTYALVVMNWTGSPDGYTIDFTQSTASLYDQTPPVPVEAVPNCGNQSFHIEFNEQIVTSTVEPTDMTITSPSGEVFNFISVTPDNSTAYAQTGFQIGLGASLLEPGIYTLVITNISGNVEDICGNIVLETTLLVTINPSLAYSLVIVDACNGMNGSLQASYVGGGVPPVQFALDGVPLLDGSALDLSADVYTLTVTDSGGCELTAQVEIPDHLLALSIAQSQDSLSCASPFVAIQGVQVQPPQNVQYAWTAITAGGTDSSFSTSASPQVTVSGLYLVEVTDPQSGCSDVASVEVFASEASDIDLSALRFPNVVSANNDGKNDDWKPFLPSVPDLDIINLFDRYSLTVYDRWGLVIHDSVDGGQRSWNASDVAQGVYFYTVAYSSECGVTTDQQRTGTITVLR